MAVTTAPETTAGRPGGVRQARRLTAMVPGALYIVIAFMVVASLLNEHFGTSANLRQVFISCAVLGVLACGTSVLLVSGQIDFAVGAEISLVAVVTSKLFADGQPAALAVGVGVLTGVLTSTLQGVVVAVFNVAPFIVSLGATTAYLGLGLQISHGRPISIGTHLTGLGLGESLGVPNVVWVFVVVAAIFYAGMRCTQFGVHAYALGGDERAAFLAGVRVRWFKLLAYVVAGVTVGIAGVVLTARAGTGSATIGSGYELQALAAAVIGGVSLTGGRGTIAGAVIGVVLLTAIDNLLALSNISGGTREMVTGGIVVAAAIVDTVRSGKFRLSAAVG